MKKMMILWICMVAILQAVNVGDILPQVTLDKENGATSSGQPWHSKNLEGKVHVVLYMDPDERKTVMAFLDTLNNKAYDKKQYSTIAIVNLAATWMPDIVLETMLSKKQKELHNTEFIFDKRKFLMNKWHLEDDASNILILDKNSKIVYQKVGGVSQEEIKDISHILSTLIK